MTVTFQFTFEPMKHLTNPGYVVNRDSEFV
jgi:hypothetical protein